MKNLKAAATDPVLSLVVAIYNDVRTVPGLLMSIEEAGAHTEVPWEVILVDNNSTDGTLELLNSFADRSRIPTTVLRETRQGVSCARNAGLRSAKGEILAVTDGDCLLAPDWPSAVVREFEANPRLAMIGGRVELYNPQDLPISVRTSRERVKITLDAFNFFHLPGCNLAFTRALTDAIGLYDDRLGPGARVPMGEDVDLVYRAVKAGFVIEYVPDVVAYHNHGRATTAQYRDTQRLYSIGMGAFYAKYLLRFHRHFAKRVYWDLRSVLRKSSKAVPGLSLGRWPLLQAYAIGLYLQITEEVLKLLGRAFGSRP